MGTISANVRVGLLAWSVAVCLLTTIPAKATEFAIVGPRATGMGGAGVAVTTDSMATYWNPAGLAMESSLDIQVAQASLQGIDRLGVKDTLDEIDSLDLTDTSLLNQARLQNLLNKLNEPGTSLAAIGSAGLYAKGSIGNFALGFNASDVATGGMFLADPVSITVGSSLTINGDFTIQGLEARQIGLSYAYAMPSRTLAIGATTKIIQGAAYLGNVGVEGANGDLRFTDDLGKAELSTAMGVDAGVMLRPASWLHLGVVGKDLNEPTFDAPGGQEFKLNPQVRGGVALVPYPALTLSFDGDITSNRTSVPGIKSRVFSLGAEHTFLQDSLALRIGALKNVEDAKSNVNATAGIGLRLLALKLDLAGGYDFRESGALVAFSVGLTF